LHERQRKYFSTGVKVFAGEWSDKKMVIARVDREELNLIINNMMSRFRKYIILIQEKNEAFDFDDLEAYLNNNVKNKESFIDFLYDRIQLRDLEESTRGQHMVLYRKIVDFGKIKNFSDLTLANIKEFDDFIRLESNKAQSTVHSVHKRLKPYVRDALELEYIKSNPYDFFKVNVGKSKNRKYLTVEELRKIEECPLNGPIANARDMFIFCCYTGLAYSDLSKFDYSKDVVKSGNTFFIQDQRKKTKIDFYTVILPKAMSLLKKWEYKIPIVSLQRYNIDLKRVQFESGIHKNLTSHMARHTFATTITLANDIPIEIVSRMLGHTNLKTTQVYAKILNTSVEKHMGELDKKLKKKKQ